MADGAGGEANPGQRVLNGLSLRAGNTYHAALSALLPAIKARS